MSNLDFDPRYIPDPADIGQARQQQAFGRVLGSQESNPDDTARAIDIAKATGYPPTVVAGDLEHHETRLKTNLSSDLVRNNPYLQDYINSHPLAADLSGNDLGNLDKASQTMSRLQKGYLENTSDIVKHALDFLRTGPTQYKEVAAQTRADLNKQGVDPVQIEGIVRNVEATAYRGEALQNLLFLGYTLALSPALGAFRTYASNPIEESTGFPAEATEGLTMVALAGLGLKALANPRVAAGATGHIFPGDSGPAAGPKGAGSVRKTMEDSAAYFGEAPETISTWSDAQLRDYLINKTSEVTKEAADVAETVRPYTAAGKEPPVGIHPVIDDANIKVSEAEVNALMESIKDAQASTTKELNSDMYAGFAKQHVEDQNVGLYADALSALYGDKPPAVDDGIVGFVADIDQRIITAQATGGYVDIPMADYIAKVDPQVAKTLEDFTRVRAAGVSKGEAKDIKAAEQVETLPPAKAEETVRDAARLDPKERKLELKRPADDKTSFIDQGHVFEIVGEQGKVADLFVGEENGGKRLYIDDIRSFGSIPNVIGPRALRDLLQQLKAEFPNAEELTGYRVSGARDKAGSWETKGKVSIKLAEPTASDHLFQILLDDRIERLGEVVEQDEGFTTTTIPEARWQNFERSIVEKINAEIERLGISDVDIAVAHKIENAKGELVRGLYQSYENARPTIIVALTADDPVGVLRHEFGHDLRTRGFIDEKEWGILEAGAKAEGWMEKHQVRERYKNLEGNEEALMEEAIVDELADWRRRGKPNETVIDKIFQKIDRIIEAIRAFLRQAFGTENWKDIFDKVESGEIGAREPGTEFAAGTKEARPTQPELPGTRRMEDRDVFAEAAAAGMTKEGYLRWMKAFAERHREDLRLESERALREAKKRQSDKWKEDSARLREQVVEQINARPDIAADNLLREARLFGRKTDPVKLGTEYLSKEELAALPKYYVAKAGDAPDQIAGLVGYASGKDLVQGLIQFNAAREASGLRGIEYTRRLIAAETERQMEAKYGSLADKILEDAKEQVLSESQIDMLSEEVLADALKAGAEYSITKDQMKSWVAERFAGMRAEDVSSDKFLADAGRAGRDIEYELIRGHNTGTAADLAKVFRQRLNQFRSIMFARLAKDFEKSQEQVDKVAEHFRPKQVKNTEQAYTNYLQGLFSEAGYPTRLTPDEIAESIKFEGYGSLDRFVAVKSSFGLDLAMEEAYAAKSVDQMTTAEFMQFKEVVDSLYHAGREAKKITVAGDRADYETWREGAVAQLEQRPLRRDKANQAEGKGNWLYNIDAPLTKIEELMKSFDFREEFGPFFNAIIVPYGQSKAQAYDMLTAISDKFKTMDKQFSKEWHRSLADTVPQNFIWDPTFKAPFEVTRWNMIKMMMNMGTESNINTLARGIASSRLPQGQIAKKEEVAAYREQIEMFIDANASAEDWKFVQFIFDMFKEWRPLADKIYRNLSGVAPKWIPDREINTRHGKFDGGYFPLIPDKSRLVGRGIREGGSEVGNGPLGADFFRATVHNAFYKERTGATYWVDISSGMEQLAGRMQQVVHDISYREFVVNASKILYDPVIRNAITNHYGKEYEAQLIPWLKRVANEFTGYEKELQGFNNIMRQVRLNLIASALPLNYSVMFTPSLGTANLKQAYAFNADRAANEALVMANSRELKHMIFNIDRDISAGLNAMVGKGSFTEYQMKAVETLFTPLTKFEQETRQVTFYGEFMHQKSLGKSDFEAATMGDSLIRERHGASAVGDLPALMASKNEFVRTATVFMGYFTVIRNWLRQFPDAVRMRDYSEMGKILWGTLGIAALYNIAVFTRCKEGESTLSCMSRAVLSTPFSMVPYVREGWTYYSEGNQPVSPIFSAMQAVGKIGKDGYNAFEGKRVKDPIKHLIGGVGQTTGIPGSLQIARTADFLYDVHRGEQRPDGIVEWMRGIFTGEARLRKR